MHNTRHVLLFCYLMSPRLVYTLSKFEAKCDDQSRLEKKLQFCAVGCDQKIINFKEKKFFSWVGSCLNSNMFTNSNMLFKSLRKLEFSLILIRLLLNKKIIFSLIPVRNLMKFSKKKTLKFEFKCSKYGHSNLSVA